MRGLQADRLSRPDRHPRAPGASTTTCASSSCSNADAAAIRRAATLARHGRPCARTAPPRSSPARRRSRKFCASRRTSCVSPPDATRRTPCPSTPIAGSAATGDRSRESSTPRARAARALKLRRTGVFPTDLERGSRARRSPGASLSARRSASACRRQELAAATRQLATLIAAGLPLVEALAALAEQTEREHLRRAIVADPRAHHAKAAHWRTRSSSTRASSRRST